MNSVNLSEVKGNSFIREMLVSDKKVLKALEKQIFILCSGCIKPV